MPKKYHIHTESAPPRFPPVGKYAVVEFREDCAGSCKACVKKKCVYAIFQEDYRHVRTTREPEYLYACQSCFRCVQECTKAIFSRVINPDYRRLGDEYYRPEMIQRTWYQAHTGKIPVSGAGYRGPFVGRGFDSMWTDMSEIVRPTRDGIHGREYINTCIELSRRPPRLAFDADMELTTAVDHIVEVPLPILFRRPPHPGATPPVTVAAALAARRLGTLMFVESADYPAGSGDDIVAGADFLIPRVGAGGWPLDLPGLDKFRAVSVADGPGVAEAITFLRAAAANAALVVSLPLTPAAPERALELTELQVDAIHFTADTHGRERGTTTPKFLQEAIRAIHLHLVEHGRRQQVNLLFSGGIAMAEHMAKAIICGADGVVVDLPLLVALECRLCGNCGQGRACPVAMDQVEPEWGSRRIVNLMAAWRNQLLEVMGAMGIREVRRLRGEVGRAMWFEDLERENFAPLFGDKTGTTKV